MRQLDILCRQCGKPLFAFNIGNSSYDRAACDNGQCLLFREGQGAVEKGSGLLAKPKAKAAEPVLTARIGQGRRPSHKPRLREKQRRYAYARRLGYGPKKAAELRSKSLDEIAKLAGLPLPRVGKERE